MVLLVRFVPVLQHPLAHIFWQDRFLFILHWCYWLLLVPYSLEIRRFCVFAGRYCPSSACEYWFRAVFIGAFWRYTRIYYHFPGGEVIGTSFCPMIVFIVLLQGQKPNRMSSNSSKYQHFRLECTLKKRLTEGFLGRFYEKFRFHSIPEDQRKRFQVKWLSKIWGQCVVFTRPAR